MPILKIQTNTEIDNREAFMQDATDFISGILQKSRIYIMIIVEPAEMLFAGESSPTAYIELKSIGLPEERTTEISEKICDFIGNRLNVQQDRIYIEFANAERHLLGWNGRTFGD